MLCHKKKQTVTQEQMSKINILRKHVHQCRKVEEVVFLPPPAFPGTRCLSSSDDAEFPETPDSLLDSREICLLTTLLLPFPARDTATELGVLWCIDVEPDTEAALLLKISLPMI